jgi:hypothetical protein
MGGLSEPECREKLNKIRERLNNKAKDVRNEFAKMEKIKVDLLKRTEEMRRSTEHDLDSMEADINKSKDLAPESQRRLHSEIAILKSEIEERHSDLKTRISTALVPA